MGHELRTPLNAIIGFIKLVEEGQYNNETERRDYLVNARQSAHSLLELINNILDLARIESGRLVLEHRPFDLRQIVEEVTKSLAPEAHAKEVEIECTLDGGLAGSFMGDSVRLRQVLVNLAGNAVKFTPAGLVLLRVERVAASQSGDTQTIRCTVQDNGIGIAEEVQARIFDSFVQSREPESATLRGLGLGLAISKQIIEQMGGKISVTSAPQQGSLFQFEIALPIDPEGAAPDSPPGHPLTGTRVLLLTFDPEIGKVYQEKLAGLRAEVSMALTAQEAYELLERHWETQHPFEAVLIDHSLGPDGAMLFARSVRLESQRYQPELVYLSLLGGGGDQHSLAEAGLSAFLTKPLTRWQLQEALAGLIGRHTELGVPKSALNALTLQASPILKFDLKATRLLVAEDNPVNQKLIHALLSKQGINVTMTANGREVVEAVRRETFDLVLMDVQMPEMDGMTATREIRASEQGKPVPIIAMTAETMAGDSERCLAAGMNDHLTKPIMPDLLYQKLTQWLDPLHSSLGDRAPVREDSPFFPFQDTRSLELDHLKAVRDYSSRHDPLRFKRWLTSFQADLNSQLTALQNSKESRDWEGVGRAAQAIGSAAAGFGAPRLREMAREVGNHAANRSAFLVDELFPFLEQEGRRINEELQRQIGTQD